MKNEKFQFYFGENPNYIKIGSGYLKVDIEIKEDFNRDLILKIFLMLITLGLSKMD